MAKLLLHDEQNDTTPKRDEKTSILVPLQGKKRAISIPDNDLTILQKKKTYSLPNF